MNNFPIHDLMKGNSWLVKLLLLSKWVSIDTKLLGKANEETSYQPNWYYYNVSNEQELCESYQMPSEILLPDDVESSFYINHNSPLKIKWDNNKPWLFFEDKPIFQIQFNDKPEFFEKKLNNNSTVRSYASMYGRYILWLFLSGYCDYIAKKHACKFCSLDIGRSTLWKKNAWTITKYHLSEVLQIIKETESERIKYFMYTAGTYIDTDNWILQQAELIKIANKIFWEGYGHHLTTMPPKNSSTLISLQEAGLQSIAYDLEVYNAELFNEYCPWKSTFYGRENMIEAAFRARDIFGKNQVKIWFVGWIEPIESLIEGMEFFWRNDFSIAVNIFHPDKWTPLGDTISRPDPEYLLNMACAQRDIFKKYNIVPVFPEWWRRSSLDTEVFRGFFDRC